MSPLRSGCADSKSECLHGGEGAGGGGCGVRFTRGVNAGDDGAGRRWLRRLMWGLVWRLVI